MENWKDAHAHLEQAGPVMNRYTTDWQARADLADADAALGLGRLDLADAALTRMPQGSRRAAGPGRPNWRRRACCRPKTAIAPPRRHFADGGKKRR